MLVPLAVLGLLVTVLIGAVVFRQLDNRPARPLPRRDAVSQALPDQPARPLPGPAIFWLLLMIGMMTVNHMIAHQRTERRLALETQRLRAALAAELRVLQELYQTNLDLLEKKANYVLSTRSPLLICKGNLGRQTSLFEESVIEQLVRLFAHNEMMEAHIAARADPKAGISYRLTPQTDVEQLGRMYTAAAHDLEGARDTLDRLDAARPSPRWRFRQAQNRKSSAQGRSVPGYLTGIATNHAASALIACTRPGQLMGRPVFKNWSA